MSCSSSQFYYFPGEDTSIDFELKTKDSSGCTKHFYLKNTDEVTVTFPGRDADLVVSGLSVKIVPDDMPYGRISIELSASDTEKLYDGTVKIKVVRDGKSKFFLASGVMKQIFQGNC